MWIALIMNRGLLRTTCQRIIKKFPCERILWNNLENNKKTIKSDALSKTTAISKTKLFEASVNGFPEIPLKESCEIPVKYVRKLLLTRI